MSIAGNSIVGVMLFGIIIGDFEVMGRSARYHNDSEYHFTCIWYFKSENSGTEAYLCIKYLVVYCDSSCDFIDFLSGGSDTDRFEII